VQPIAFRIGNFPIYFYGLMMVIAYIIVFLIMRKTRKHENLSLETALDTTIFIIIGGVVGARIFYILLNLGEYIHTPLSFFNVREGGLSWHGALIGGLIGAFLLARAKKLPLGVVSDFAAVHSTIALAIGRMGCFMNGCCYGKPTSYFTGVHFTAAGLAHPRHPTQIYEALLMVVSFFILLSWWKKKKFNGELTLLMFSMYGIVRFIVEFFRDNTADQYIGLTNLSLAQYLSIAMTLGCGIVLYVKRKNIRIKEDGLTNQT
jgi:phosphatidylglycerol---prolipoprotein diacylglyceryl transferase